MSLTFEEKLKKIDIDHKDYIEKNKVNQKAKGRQFTFFDTYKNTQSEFETTYQQTFQGISKPSYDTLKIYNLNLHSFKHNSHIPLNTEYRQLIQKRQTFKEPEINKIHDFQIQLPQSQYNPRQPLDFLTTNKKTYLQWNNCKADIYHPSHYDDPNQGFIDKQISTYQLAHSEQKMKKYPLENIIFGKHSQVINKSPYSFELPTVYQTQNRQDYNQIQKQQYEELIEQKINDRKKFINDKIINNYKNQYLTQNKKNYLNQNNQFLNQNLTNFS